MGQVYQWWWRICRDTYFFRFEYHVFYVLYPFVTYLLTLPLIFPFYCAIGSIFVTASMSANDVTVLGARKIKKTKTLR
jgi:hypothetical protein